jgi:2-dehydropantoate 2-reductase
MDNKWHILGAGSIGSLFAAALSDSGCKTTLLLRNNRESTSNAPCFRTFYVRQNDQQRQFVLPVSPANESNYISHLLVTTKAYDACTALGSIAHRLDERSSILILVNGMGVLQELEAEHPHLHYYCATTTEGAYRQSPEEFIHAGTGLTKIGHGNVAHPQWFNQWQKLALTCTWEADIERTLWHKLAVNCAINPLTALHQCKNGELLLSKTLSEKLGLVCDEIAIISKAVGYTATAQQIHLDVEEVITNTAKNRSSMLQDVLAKKQTEIEYISGYMVNTAERLGIPAPINAGLLNSVRELKC